MSKEFYDPNDFKTEEISPARVDLEKSPKENLDALLVDFEKVGVFIDSNCIIANSTLLELIKLVNELLIPREGTYEQRKELNDAIVITRMGLSERSRKLANFLHEVGLTRNLNIHIGAHVTIGERVSFMPSVAIGAGTQIGDKVRIRDHVEIGGNCKIGKYCHLNSFVSIADDVVVDERTTFRNEDNIPKGSRVTHESPNSSMARIEKF